MCTKEYTPGLTEQRLVVGMQEKTSRSGRVNRKNTGHQFSTPLTTVCVSGDE